MKCKDCPAMHTPRGERWLKAWGHGLCMVPGRGCAGVDPEAENHCVWNVDDDGRIVGGYAMGEEMYQILLERTKEEEEDV